MCVDDMRRLQEQRQRQKNSSSKNSNGFAAGLPCETEGQTNKGKAGMWR
jgi:hypothetical protein